MLYIKHILLSFYRNMNLHMRTAHTRFGCTAPTGNRVRICIGYEFSLNLPVVVVGGGGGGGGDDDDVLLLVLLFILFSSLHNYVILK